MVVQGGKTVKRIPRIRKPKFSWLFLASWPLCLCGDSLSALSQVTGSAFALACNTVLLYALVLDIKEFSLTLWCIHKRNVACAVKRGLSPIPEILPKRVAPAIPGGRICRALLYRLGQAARLGETVRPGIRDAWTGQGVAGLQLRAGQAPAGG